MDLFNNKKIKIFQEEIKTKEILVKELKSRNDFLEKMYKNISNSSEMIYEDNRKLIQWIEKIIEAFDVFEVPNRDRIQIPIYKFSSTPSFYNINEIGRIREEAIIIPEIIISKRKIGDK